MRKAVVTAGLRRRRREGDWAAKVGKTGIGSGDEEGSSNGGVTAAEAGGEEVEDCGLSSVVSRRYLHKRLVRKGGGEWKWDLHKRSIHTERSFTAAVEVATLAMSDRVAVGGVREVATLAMSARVAVGGVMVVVWWG